MQNEYVEDMKHYRYTYVDSLISLMLLYNYWNNVFSFLLPTIILYKFKVDRLQALWFDVPGQGRIPLLSSFPAGQ